MRALRTFIYALAVVSLAACGGGSGGRALPPAATDPGAAVPAPATDSGGLAPAGSSVAFQSATLWIAYDPPRLNAFPTNGNGAVTPERSLGTVAWSPTDPPGIVDVAVAPDGTVWMLENRNFAEGGRGWRLFAFAPGATVPENQEGDDVDVPFQVALGGDGVMVGYVSVADGTDVIATYPYGASNAAPIRTFRGTVHGFQSGNDGHLYVAGATGIDVYSPTSTGCCPIRHIATGKTEGLFAVGPDNSIYIPEFPGNNNNPVMYVAVYAPGSSTVARRIGPLPANYNGFGGAEIAVDAGNRLYVATQGSIYRFGRNANGAAKPERLMTDPTQGRARAMAVGPKLKRTRATGFGM